MGHFGIGIYNPKFDTNIGTLWRSAYLLGAAYIFIIEGKFKRYATDTQKTWKQIPLHMFHSTNDLPIDTELVLVETKDVRRLAVDLPFFQHPNRCAYLLGNEGRGLPDDLLPDAKTVCVPAIRAQSYNVSMAGTLIMYDRMIKKHYKQRTI